MTYKKNPRPNKHRGTTGHQIIQQKSNEDLEVVEDRNGNKILASIDKERPKKISRVERMRIAHAKRLIKEREISFLRGVLVGIAIGCLLGMIIVGIAVTKFV